MNLDKIQSIQISLLKRETDPDKKHKAVYSKKKTAKFVFPTDFPRTEEYFGALLEDMYNDLRTDAPGDIDSIGMWVEYDTITLENAISLRTLDDIKEYSKEELNPALEFFKMTVIE